MWEFEVLLQNGERDIIFGYSIENALYRSGLNLKDIVDILNAEYVD